MTRAMPVKKKAEAFVKDQLAEARQRLTLVETEAGKVATKAEKAAQKAVKQVTSRAEKLATQAEKAAGKAVKDFRTQAKKSEKDVRTFLKGILPPDAGPVRELTVRAQALTGQLLQNLQTLQTKAFETTGVASKLEVKTLAKEVSRLTKKVETLLKQSSDSQ